MVYTILAAILIVLALFVVLAAGRLLFKGNWLLGWLRGMSGFIMLAAAILLALVAFDFYSYKQLAREQTVASISFDQLGYQQFKVSLVDSDGVEQVHNLTGDLWQLDARIIKWNKSLAALGLSPGYRLDRLSGRFYSLEKEQTAQHTVYELDNSKSLLDVWHWLRKYGTKLAIIDATYGSATYLPMEDGALFSVSLTNSGLIARPLNDRAHHALDNWQ